MKPLLFKSIAIFTFILFLAGCSAKTKDIPYDDIRNPRFSADGKQIIFDIANAGYHEKSRIHVYNMESKTMSSYIPLNGQRFDHAYFSDNGKKIVFITAPIGDPNKTLYEQRHEILPNSQVATMNVDGSDFQVLTSVKGAKIFPAFSHKGDKIIFAMTDHIRDSGNTMLSRFDLYELDIKSKQIRLFMGRKFEFYQMWLSTYFNDDETVLLAGHTPQINLPFGLNRSDYMKKANDSYVFTVKRGQTDIGMPILIEFRYSYSSTMDSNENIYFDGAKPDKGYEVMRLETDGKIVSFGFPQNCSLISSSYVTRDGHYYIASCPSVSTSKRRLVLLDTVMSQWSELIIPKTAKEIQVKQK